MTRRRVDKSLNMTVVNRAAFMGYLLSTFGEGFYMLKDSTAAEDIRDVLQLLALVKERPCITGKSGGARATAITYREIFAAQKRLTSAAEKLEYEANLKAGLPAKDDWSNKVPVWNSSLGTPRLVHNDLPQGWSVEWRNAGEAVVSGWELMEGTAHRGFFDSEQKAIRAAIELSADSVE